MNNFDLFDKQALEVNVQNGAKILSISYDPTTVVGSPESQIPVGYTEYYREDYARLVEVIYTLGGVPTPIFNLDLTSTASYPELSFSRAGSRIAIENGIFVTKSSNQPAIESWDGINRGLAIEASPTAGAITQYLLQSDNMLNAAWTANTAGLAGSAGGSVGPFGSGSCTILSETASAAFHQIIGQINSLSIGQKMTYSVVCRLKSGASKWSVRLNSGPWFNNIANIADFRIDGIPGHYNVQNDSMGTGVTSGVKKLANGLYLLWMTMTIAAAGNHWFQVQTIPNDNQGTGGAFYTGNTADGIELFGMNVHQAESAAGWISTTSSTLTQAPEVVTLTHAALASLTEGTFLIEHDCYTGVLIGSGSNTIVSATRPGKTAISWDAIGSDTVHNGGATSAGASPTFGADIRLLANSTTGNVGHIKNIQFFNTKLSVAELQALTSPIASVLTPGIYRAASVDDRLPQGVHTTSGSLTHIASRFRVKLGNRAFSSLKFDFANIGGMLLTVGNSVIVDDVFLERVSTPQCVRVTKSGSNSFTMTDQQVNVLTDAILPTSFGLTEFPANEEFWVQVKAHVVSTGQKIPIGRRMTQTNSVSRVYNPATGSPTSFGTPGTLTWAGAGGTDWANMSTYGFCPILVGIPTAGDPPTWFVCGDSIIESVIATPNSGTYCKRALENLGQPSIEFSAGGAMTDTISETSFWKNYLPYCRYWFDEFGANNANKHANHFRIINDLRTTYNYSKIVHFALLPKTSGTFTSDAGQTLLPTFDLVNEHHKCYESMMKYGFFDYHAVPMSIRSLTDPNKWSSNPVPTTIDGNHQSTAGDDLLTAEIQPILASITA